MKSRITTMAQSTSLEFLSSEWDPCPTVVSGEEKGAAGPPLPYELPHSGPISLIMHFLDRFEADRKEQQRCRILPIRCSFSLT